jgi:hypothetical protein
VVIFFDPGWESAAALACFHLPGQRFPRFRLTGGPDEDLGAQVSFNGQEQITREAGFVEVELEGNPAFEKFFKVNLYDLDEERTLRSLLTRDVQDWFMLHRQRKWSVEGAGEWIGEVNYNKDYGSRHDLEAWLKEIRPVYELFASARGGTGKEGRE